jgi:UDP-glucose 4-epimerase
MLPKILVTGGAGYIGSHTTMELCTAGHSVVVLDNLSNSQSDTIEHVQSLFPQQLTFVQGDARDSALLEHLFTEHLFSGVIHFAGLKAVGESVTQPLRYFDNNLGCNMALFQAMEQGGVRRLVFSSSATVYGDPEQVPIVESSPLRVTNPYGRTKLMAEDMLRDMQAADPRWQVAILRYFNPVGAHASGQLGERPNGTPNNLMPYITQVAAGLRDRLHVFGNDYPTPDGTGVRDYIHVVDLAQGHLAALKYLANTGQSITVNLGTGHGISVLELVKTFERVNQVAVPYQIDPRRPGDVASCYADTTLATQLLGWRTQLTLDDMCRDAWRWQQNRA